MKSLHVCSLAIAFAFLIFQTIAYGLSPQRRFTGELSLHGTLNRTVIPHRGGTVYLHLDIATNGFAIPDRPVQPMNVSVVLDRSGSMADERKIEYAREAVCRLVDRLSENDYLSIVIYDSDVDVLVETQRIGRDREQIKRLVRQVEPRSATNLGAGMEGGFRQVERMRNREYLNRVILLSDGLANRGITDPLELGHIARRYRERSISLTSMGVGLDYNENLMMDLAESGGGNYYFIESPSQLTSIFDRELSGMSSIIAQNARIELRLGDGVRLLDAIGYDVLRENGSITIPLGDLAADKRHEIILELSVPQGTGSRRVAQGSLRYNGQELRRKHPDFSVDIRYNDDVAAIDRSTDWDIQAKTDVALSTRQVERAMKSFDEGRREDAAVEMGTARSLLQSSKALTRSSPAAAPTIQSQINELKLYEREIRSDSTDSRKVKKSIQYRNYQRQKSKAPDEK